MSVSSSNQNDFYGWEKNAFTREEHVIVSEYILIFMVIMCCSFLLQYYVKHVWKSKWLPESGATLAFTMLIGGILRLSVGNALDDIKTYDDADAENWTFQILVFGRFSTNIFYFGFLPPIIYNSGYHLKRKLFFDNFGGIISLAVVGTSMSVLTIGAAIYWTNQLLYNGSYNLPFVECIAFASLLASTDPVATLSIYADLRVDPMLFYLVFGESVLNDAIAITIFKVTTKFVGVNSMPTSAIYAAIVQACIIFVGSCVIGYGVGLLIALLFKICKFQTEHPITPVCVFLCAVYVPYFLAEMLQLSGIVSIFFTGMAARRYVNKNLNLNERKMSSFVFQMLAYFAESATFSLLGLSIFMMDLHEYDLWFILSTLAVCFLSRIYVYPILTLVNLYRRYDRGTNPAMRGVHEDFVTIPTNTKHAVFFAGLRGAVAYALANIFPDDNGNKKLVLATTTVIIVATVFLLGGSTETIIQHLEIPTQVDASQYASAAKAAQRLRRRAVKHSDTCCCIRVMPGRMYGAGTGEDDVEGGGASCMSGALEDSLSPRAFECERWCLYPLIVNDGYNKREKPNRGGFMPYDTGDEEPDRHMSAAFSVTESNLLKVSRGEGNTPMANRWNKRPASVPILFAPNTGGGDDTSLGEGFPSDAFDYDYEVSSSGGGSRITETYNSTAHRSKPSIALNTEDSVRRPVNDVWSPSSVNRPVTPTQRGIAEPEPEYYPVSPSHINHSRISSFDTVSTGIGTHLSGVGSGAGLSHGNTLATDAAYHQLKGHTQHLSLSSVQPKTSSLHSRGDSHVSNLQQRITKNQQYTTTAGSNARDSTLSNPAGRTERSGNGEQKRGGCR
jgi:sodium/hydrogen exchanger 3